PPALRTGRGPGGDARVRHPGSRGRRGAGRIERTTQPGDVLGRVPDRPGGSHRSMSGLGTAVRGRESWARVLSLLATVAVWQLGAPMTHRPPLPPPEVVATRLGRSLVTGELPYHLGITLARVAASFVLAMGIGTTWGVLMGRFRSVDVGLDGILILALNIPALVTAILCYVWIGLNEVAAVTAVALNKIPTVVVSLREGARAVDLGLLDVARVFRVPRGRVFLHVYLPQLHPY